MHLWFFVNVFFCGLWLCSMVLAYATCVCVDALRFALLRDAEVLRAAVAYLRDRGIMLYVQV
jgi:hypothetical protein